MFTLDSDNTITAFNEPPETPVFGSAIFSDKVQSFRTARELSDILHASPGERAVAIWNHLSGKFPVVAPILTPKFRNKSTAVERIWNRLAQLYPDAILESDMPKAKTKATKPKATKEDAKPTRNARKLNAAQKRTSAWADELQSELTKRFRVGQEFTLDQVYELASEFKQRHKANKNIEAKLRQTVNRLRERSLLKIVGRGRYQRLASR